MRGAEVVTTILINPIREDPWGALIANIVLTTRRLLRKSEARASEFIAEVNRVNARPGGWKKAAPALPQRYSVP